MRQNNCLASLYYKVPMKSRWQQCAWLRGRDSTLGDRGRTRQRVTRILRIPLAKPAASITSRNVIREGQTPTPSVCHRKTIIKSGNLKLIYFCSLLNEAISSWDCTEPKEKFRDELERFRSNQYWPNEGKIPEITMDSCGEPQDLSQDIVCPGQNSSQISIDHIFDTSQ